MRRTLLLLLAGLFTVSTLCASPTSAGENTIDLNKPGKFGLGICQSDLQLDCLEPKVIVTHKDGSSSSATFISSSSDLPYLDISENNLYMFHGFKVHSGTANGISRDFRVRTEFTTPSSKPFGGMFLSVISLKKLDPDECSESLRKLCSRYTLNPDDEFKFVMRTQKLQVQGLKAIAANGEIAREDYLTGEKWIMSGSQTLPGWNPGLSWWIEPIGDGAQFPLRSKAQCAGNGVLFTSSNSVTSGLPSWDKRNNSLNFGISGPHLDANGDLFQGFFKARIPKKWLDCAYPENTLSIASQVVVSITYDDGSIQVATSSTRVTDEIIYIDVPVLHFSSPTIRITNASLAKPAPTPRVLKCIKGKVKKLFTAVKCPSGWKLVA